MSEEFIPKRENGEIGAATGRFGDHDVVLKGSALAGQSVALGVCGGIGSVDCVRLIRELRRHGAKVRVFMSPSARQFVGETSLQWASQHPVVSDLESELFELSDYSFLLFAPMTWNSLAKFATGVADNSVSFLFAAQISRQLPVYVVPTMNESLWNHPLCTEYCERLRTWGVRIFYGELKESRLKMPEPVELMDWLLSDLKREASLRGN